MIVDEEQRFGVKHKERLKQIKKTVDVIAMSATPIPRTLHMSLLGLRDMSVIETPPKDRLAIQTVVAPIHTGHDPSVDRAGTESRRAGLFRAQPDRFDLARARPWFRSWCPRRASAWATARWAKRSWNR